MSNRLHFAKMARLRPAYPLVSPPASVGSRLRDAWRRYRSRQRIALLDGHARKDIGLSLADAETEANKWFWQG